jgi:hypothetical protein
MLNLINGEIIPAELIREEEQRLAETSECQAGTDSVSFQVLPASTVLTATSNQSWLVVTKTGLGQSTPGGQAFAIPPQLRITDAADNGVQGANVTFTVVPASGGAGADQLRQKSYRACADGQQYPRNIHRDGQRGTLAAPFSVAVAAN